MTAPNELGAPTDLASRSTFLIISILMGGYRLRQMDAKPSIEFIKVPEAADDGSAESVTSRGALAGKLSVRSPQFLRTPPEGATL